MKGKLKITNTEVVYKDKNKTRRYPNLQTVLMVEEFLKARRDLPLRLSEIKKDLPRKIMHPTLIVILEYLWRSGKIIYGPRGIQWIYSEPEHLRKMLDNALEV
jgi:hypothetical protein